MQPGTSALFQVQALVLLLVVSLGVAVLARRLRFPYTLALVLVGLLLGFLRLVPNLRLEPDLVLFIFLPALLFEGAWNLDLARLRANWLAIALLAVPGLLISLGVVAAVLHWGAGLPWTLALLLGAIVSPTDPVAVLALLRQLGMPARLRVLVEAESIFNDGVGVVAYDLILAVLLVTLGLHSELLDGPAWLVALKGLWLCAGGPLLGVAAGLLVTRFVRRIDDHLIETTVTFGTAYGVYLLADALHTSGLLAVVCAGLVLGNVGRRVGMSERTAAVVDTVWEFAGYIGNSLLFLLLGVLIGAASLFGAVAPILWAVAGVIAGRALMIYTLLPLHDAYARRAARRRKAAGRSRRGAAVPIPAAWRPLLLLSGLRGALSIALALSLPTTVPRRDGLALVVYGVVLVTLVGQGIAMRLLLPRWPGTRAA